MFDSGIVSGLSIDVLIFFVEIILDVESSTSTASNPLLDPTVQKYIRVRAKSLQLNLQCGLNKNESGNAAASSNASRTWRGPNSFRSIRDGAQSCIMPRIRSLSVSRSRDRLRSAIGAIGDRAIRGHLRSEIADFRLLQTSKT